MGVFSLFEILISATSFSVLKIFVTPEIRMASSSDNSQRIPLDAKLLFLQSVEPSTFISHELLSRIGLFELSKRRISSSNEISSILLIERFSIAFTFVSNVSN